MTPARKRANTAINKPVMEKCCLGLEVDIEEINTNSFRLTKQGYWAVDYYPGTQRAFIMAGTAKSHVGVRNLIEFLCSCFDDEIGYLLKDKNSMRNAAIRGLFK